MVAILIIILILLLIYGIICIVKPEWIQKITEFQKTTDGESSETFLKQLRQSGILCTVTAVLLLIAFCVTFIKGM